MAAVCPAGHPTSTSDWCQVCGRPVGDPVGPATCSACGSARPGRFCDECGADATVPLWWARITRDRAWYEHVTAGRTDPPEFVDVEPWRVRLDHDRMVVGRRSRRHPSHRDSGIDSGIDIDVDDPGVSARHAVLIGTGDGWAVADLSSSNGTAVAPGFTTVTAGVPVAVPTGGWVRIGAWTAIHLEPPP